MKDKDKLKKLVQIIGDLLKVKGNEWLVDEILKTLGKSYPVDQIANYSLIEEIHEHCIKKIICQQAQDFYNQFPIKDKDLVEKLIYDFVEMEYNRRRNRFYEFSFCINQQIEGITNYLFYKKYKSEWLSLNSEFKNKIVEDYKTNSRHVRSTLQDVIIKKDKEVEDKWSDLSKFKVVYYFINKPKNRRLPFNFKNMRDIRQEVSIARNESHRGTGMYDWQKKILNKIQGNESKYYFKFHGFLQDFVCQIENSYKN